MKDLIIKYWLQVFFGLVISGMGAGYKILSKRIYKQICDQESLRDGTQALLRNEIIRAYDTYMERRYISIHGLENVLAMYNSYHALGGNGTITKLVEELKELPTKSREVKGYV